MPLNQNDLASALSTAWAAFPPTTDAGALATAAAYNTYALAAMAPSGLPPSLVMLADLQDGLKAALAAGGSYSDGAQAWADAFEAFWTNALFGATSTPPVIPGTSTLKSGLEGLWTSQSITMTLFPASAAQHASLLHTFTTAIIVGDTVVPPPSGTPPGPIS